MSRYRAMMQATGNISMQICFHHPKISKLSSLLYTSTNRADKYLSSFEVYLTIRDPILPRPIIKLIRKFLDIKLLLNLRLQHAKSIVADFWTWHYTLYFSDFFSPMWILSKETNEITLFCIYLDIINPLSSYAMKTFPTLENQIS